MNAAKRTITGRVAAMLALGVTAACGAPASEEATGPVAEEVRASLSGGTVAFDHAAWDSLLAGGTRDGLVDYGFMRTHRATLDRYLDRVARADLASLAPDHLKALLLNAYNALTVRAILDHEGVASIREIDGVWTAQLHDVGGHELTLDNIEHNLLRPFFRDPRIHFAVNCASMSCAPLPRWAFTGESLNRELEERTRSFLTDPDNVAIDGEALSVSKYFEWYGEDFTQSGWEPRAETIAGFIARYATPAVREFVEANPGVALRFRDYDWSLNHAGGAPTTSAARAVRIASWIPLGGLSTQEAAPAEAPEGVSGWVMGLLDWVEGFGWAAPLVYGALYVILAVVLVPGGALTIGAGFAFGMWVGALTVIVAANLAAALAFLIARYAMRGRVESWLAGRERLSAVDRAVESQGWKVVVLTRLSPVFPFNVQNYFYGLTGVPFWHYVGASLIGMLPGTLLYVYIGFAGAQVARAAGGAAGWGQTALLGAGLVATLVVVVLVTRVAKRELDRATGAGQPADPLATAAS